MRKLLLTCVAILASGCGVGLTSGTGSGCSLASYSTNTSPAVLPINHPNYGAHDAAQSFKLATAAKAVSVTIPLSKVGTFNSLDYIQIFIDPDKGSSGLGPTGTPVTANAQSGKLYISSISTTEQWYTGALLGSVALSANTTYWIRVYASYAQSSASYVQWYANNDPASPYAGGTAVYESNTTAGNYSNSLLSAYWDQLFNLGC